MTEKKQIVPNDSLQTLLQKENLNTFNPTLDRPECPVLKFFLRSAEHYETSLYPSLDSSVAHHCLCY